MIVHVNKIWKGGVSVRDYMVEKAKAKKEKLIIKYNDEQMTVLFEDLDKGQKNGMALKSNYSDKPYDLIDFHWSPDRKE